MRCPNLLPWCFCFEITLFPPCIFCMLHNSQCSVSTSLIFISLESRFIVFLMRLSFLTLLSLCVLNKIFICHFVQEHTFFVNLKMSLRVDTCIPISMSILTRASIYHVFLCMSQEMKLSIGSSDTVSLTIPKWLQQSCRNLGAKNYVCACNPRVIRREGGGAKIFSLLLDSNQFFENRSNSFIEI